MGEKYTYKQKNADGSIYVYECEHEYIPELKQTRKKNRKLIGKLDENGNLVPTREKRPPRVLTLTEQVHTHPDYRALERKVESLTNRIHQLSDELSASKRDAAGYKRMIRQALNALNGLPISPEDED